MRKNIFMLMIVFLSFLVAGCGSKEAGHHQHKESVTIHPEHNQTAIAVDTAVKKFNLEAYQFGYSPENIVVQKGDIVKISATSRDVPHGIFVKEYGINVTVKKGAVEEIDFVADKAGEFDILCSVYCGHGHHSMKAKLIVE